MKVTGRSLTLILRKPNIIISKQGVCNDHLRKIANGILEESIAKQSYEEWDMDVDEQYVMRKELSNQLLETPSIQRLKVTYKFCDLNQLYYRLINLKLDRAQLN